MEHLSLSKPAKRTSSRDISPRWRVIDINADTRDVRRLAVLQDRRTVRLIPVASILWVEGSKRRVRIHVEGAKVTSDGPLVALTTALGPGFLQVSRNTTVNLAAIGEVRGRSRTDESVVRLFDGTELKVTRQYMSRLRGWLADARTTGTMAVVERSGLIGGGAS